MAEFRDVESGFSAIASRRSYALRMAEAASTENVTARLAQVRDGLKLLADYL